MTTTCFPEVWRFGVNSRCWETCLEQRSEVRGQGSGVRCWWKTKNKPSTTAFPARGQLPKPTEQTANLGGLPVSLRAGCQARQPASATGVPQPCRRQCRPTPRAILSMALELRRPQAWLRGNFLGSPTLSRRMRPSGNPTRVQRVKSQ